MVGAKKNLSNIATSRPKETWHHYRIFVTFLLIRTLKINIQVACVPMLGGIINFIESDLRRLKNGDVMGASVCASEEECCSECLVLQQCCHLRIYAQGNFYVAEFISDKSCDDMR